MKKITFLVLLVAIAITGALITVTPAHATTTYHISNSGGNFSVQASGSNSALNITGHATATTGSFSGNYTVNGVNHNISGQATVIYRDGKKILHIHLNR